MRTHKTLFMEGYLSLFSRSPFRVAGKSAGRSAFLPVGRGGEESRPCNQIHISRKPRPVGGELHYFSAKEDLSLSFLTSSEYGDLVRILLNWDL